MTDRPTNRVSARVISDTTKETISRFITEHIDPESRTYTDDAPVYDWLPNHESVKHSVAEYVRGQTHTNGIELFWAMLKRAYVGTYHKISVKHLARYIAEFSRRHNIRDLDTAEQMRDIVTGLVGRRLMYKDLIL